MGDNLIENIPLGKKIRKILLRILCLLLTTVLLFGAFLYGLMYLYCKGPSEAAKEQFVRYALSDERTAFLPGLYLSHEEIAAIDAEAELKEAANG